MEMTFNNNMVLMKMKTSAIFLLVSREARGSWVSVPNQGLQQVVLGGPTTVRQVHQPAAVELAQHRRVRLQSAMRSQSKNHQTTYLGDLLSAVPQQDALGDRADLGVVPAVRAVVGTPIILHIT